MKFLLPGAALIAAALLAGCGGGGGSSSSGGSTPPPTVEQGSLSLGLAGAALAGYDHVWVTISGVALHTDANRPWSAGDSSWQVLRLDKPITIDVAAQTNGNVAALITGRALPPGIYQQLRLFVVSHDATLADSAKALSLQFNDEAVSTDTGGASHTVPLELADATPGLRLPGPITVAANTDTDLTVQWDLERSLAHFAADDVVDRLSLRPDLRGYDVENTGAIVGVVDKSLFCAAGVRASSCIYDVVASAELPSADGRFKRSVRSAPVVVGAQYAVFALYPLPALGSDGRFDVVIRGRNMRTMVVRAVPAPAADLLHATPTQLGANPADTSNPSPMLPVLSSGDASVTLAQPMARTGSRLLFGQTLPGPGELPLEIASANVDPFSGRLALPQPLPSGPLRVATYTSDAVLSFADVVPQEGADTYSVMSLGTSYDAPSATQALAVPPGASASFTAPEPQPLSLPSGTLSVALSGGSTQKYDAAELVVSDVNGIVLTRDVSASVGAPGTLTLAVPQGADAAALGATAVYGVGVRLWKRAAPQSSVTWVRVSSPVDLRSANSASVSLALP